MLKIAWYKNSIAERTHAIHNIVTKSATMKQVCVSYVFGPTWTPVDYNHPACVMSSSCLRCHALIWIRAVRVNRFVVRVRFFKILWKITDTYFPYLLAWSSVDTSHQRTNGQTEAKLKPKCKTENQTQRLCFRSFLSQHTTRPYTLALNNDFLKYKKWLTFFKPTIKTK